MHDLIKEVEDNIKNNIPFRWIDIADKYNIQLSKKSSKDNPLESRIARAKKANDIWRKYIKAINKLEPIKISIDVNGDISNITKGIRKKESKIDLTGFKIKKYVSNPYGSSWVTYVKESESFKDVEKNIKKILEKDVSKSEIDYKVDNTNLKALFIYGADKHIGALTKSDSIYKNIYDVEEIKRRLINNIIKYIEEEVNNFGTFESLYIMDLGDALDGFNQKTTGGLRGTSSHTLPQQLNNIEQYTLYIEVHKTLFDIIAKEKYAKNIYFISTSNSNHGGDFEYFSMDHLKTYLNLKYPFIKTFVSYKHLNHFIYGNHCIIFGHGKDTEDLKFGLPLTINDKTSEYLNNYIDINNLGNYTISVITADLHQSAKTYSRRIRYKKVLSQYGSSKWMHTNFGSGSPGVSIDIICKDSDKIYEIDRFYNIGNQGNTGFIL